MPRRASDLRDRGYFQRETQKVTNEGPASSQHAPSVTGTNLDPDRVDDSEQRRRGASKPIDDRPARH